MSFLDYSFQLLFDRSWSSTLPHAGRSSRYPMQASFIFNNSIAPMQSEEKAQRSSSIRHAKRSHPLPSTTCVHAGWDGRGGVKAESRNAITCTNRPMILKNTKGLSAHFSDRDWYGRSKEPVLECPFWTILSSYSSTVLGQVLCPMRAGLVDTPCRHLLFLTTQSLPRRAKKKLNDRRLPRSPLPALW